MNILLVRPYFNIGGTEKIIIDLCQEMTSWSNIHLATGGGMQLNKLPSDVEIHLVPLYPSNPINLMRATYSIRNIITSNQISIINSHHRFSSLVSNLATIRTDIPVVSTFHEMLPAPSIGSQFLIGDSAIVFTKAVKYYLINKYNYSESNIFQSSVGTSISHVSDQDITNFVQLFKLDTSKTIVATIARLSWEKGIDIYLNAIKRVLEQWNEVVFIVVGDGPLKGELIRLAKELDIQKHVVFTGWVQNVSVVYSVADFFVLPSRSEALGLSILEAWSFGKPTIASRVGGIPEIIDDKIDGILFEPNDPNSLASNIVNFLHHSQEIKILGVAGMEKVLSQYQIQRMSENMKSIFTSILSSNNKKRF